MPERERVTIHKSYHRYANFKVTGCSGVSEEDQKSLEEELKDAHSDIRRDIRRLFEAQPLGKHELDVTFHPRRLGMSAGCIVEFEKVK